MYAKQLRKSSDQLRAVLADNLRTLRRNKKISQEELAELCGLHRTYVGSVERCERNVTLSSLEMFAQAFGVSVPEILTPKVYDEHEQQPTP